MPFLILLIWAHSLSADFQAGLTAYQKGDFASALKEWQPLADKGAAEAQYNLGLLYAKGQGVQQDSAQAANWYRKAAEQGFVEAEFNLGLLYSGGEGVPKDSSEAMKWFLKAAEKGDAKAADTVGSFFEAEGTFKNYAEAEKWYRKAAEQGVASAQFNLGAMYDIGQGVKVDFAEAEKWYRKAAEQGYAAALCNIAILYYNGQGVKLDRVQAHQYFLLAQAAGEPRASNLIKLTTEKLNPKQIAQAREMAQSWKQAHASRPSSPTAQPTTELASVPKPAVASKVASNAAPSSSRAVWTGVERVIAVGDVHGDYPQFVDVLRSAKLIDDQNNWSGGKTHLVQTGDVVDRGGESRQVMDLLMKLEKQAREAGGFVHCLLGNHEAMDIYGDLRYVSPGEYASFRDENSEKLRDQNYAQYRDQVAKLKLQEESREDWYAQHPLGFFEHRAAFGIDGVYGKWLRTHDTAIRIDDTLYTHAGLAETYARYSLDEINQKVREELDDPRRLHGGIVTDEQGPLLYRGLAKGDEKALSAGLDQALRKFGAKREVIGHSYANAAITPRFDGRVIMIDIGLSRVYDNIAKLGCLLFEGGKPYALHRGNKLELPKDERADMLRYLKQAAALDPAPSPLAARIKDTEAKP
ncbi:MAG: metallophosphoesterase [Acidobacteriota bacterium]|nr:metallophosphoesterase [Acidobacteriota bacterium]